MKVYILIFGVMLISGCSLSDKEPALVKKLDNRTRIDTISRPYVIKEFFLIDPVPNSSEELERVMIQVSKSNPHRKYDNEIFVFIKEVEDILSDESYVKDSTSGIEPNDILGTVEYENKNGKRILIELER